MVVMKQSTPLEFFFFQAEDGIRDLVRSRGLGDVYKRQLEETPKPSVKKSEQMVEESEIAAKPRRKSKSQPLSPH